MNCQWKGFYLAQMDKSLQANLEAKYIFESKQENVVGGCFEIQWMFI